MSRRRRERRLPPPPRCLTCTLGATPQPTLEQWRLRLRAASARWPRLSTAACAAGPLLLVAAAACAYTADLRPLSPGLAAAGLAAAFLAEFVPLCPLPLTDTNSFTVSSNPYTSAGIGLALCATAAFVLADCLAAIEEWSNVVHYRRKADTERIWSHDGGAALSLVTTVAPTAAILVLAFQLHWAPRIKA